MRKRIALLLCLAMLASVFAGCDVSIDSILSMIPGFNNTQPTEPEAPTETLPTEPADPWAQYECITISEALALCELFVDAPSAERYYIRATIKSIDNDTYGQMTITDDTGSIMVYGTANADGSVRYDAMTDKPVAGDEVLLYGTLQNYKGNTKEVQNGWIIDFISKGQSEQPSELPADGTELTVTEILALPVPSGVTTTQHYIVKATVESISNVTYGAMWITDGTNSISVYNSKNADGSVGYADMEDKPYKGDSVTLKCTVQNFNGTMEIKQAYILEFTHEEVTVNPEDYTEMSIADARETAKGAKVKVTGVVARITFANGMKPSGVILVDETSSIYVYDGDIAGRVAIGNQITILAEKDYWILDDEQNNAAKFGYKGCNQLTSAVYVEGDTENHSFDTSWMESSTVKEIIDTPVNVDISTKIFKVTAQVKKVPGAGFTNYYFFDLDGTTGTYTYTQCNGNDFTWLDEFDGKICTVYLTALNAKSTVSDCYWRLLPVAVVDEGFDPATVNAAEHGVKYYGIGQFQNSYSGNPALELLTSVNAELLGFEGIALGYKSSDPSVISVDGNVMNCLKTGEATITIIGTYGEQTYSTDVTITVTIEEDDNTYATVKEAIDATVGETVEVKGIVGPSLVNKVGFYLIDDTGVIAVETTADVLATMEIGNEVVLTATRAINTKGGTSYYGQTCLKDAAVKVNNYGTYAYSTNAFKGNLTVAELKALNVLEDHSTDVYTVTASIKVVATSYYTNVYLTDGSNDVILYAGNGKVQHAWLIELDGQEVTVEVAPCNWNDKTSYAGCVLAIVNADGTKTVNTLNFN